MKGASKQFELLSRNWSGRTEENVFNSMLI